MRFYYGSLLVLVAFLASDTAFGNRNFQTDTYAGMNIVRPGMKINGDPWLYSTTYEEDDLNGNSQKVSKAAGNEWNKFNNNEDGMYVANQNSQAPKKWIGNSQNTIQSTKVHSYSPGIQESTKPVLNPYEWQKEVNGAINLYPTKSDQNLMGTISKPGWNNAQTTTIQMQSLQVPDQEQANNQVNLPENQSSSMDQSITNEWKGTTASQNQYNRPKVTPAVYNGAQNTEWNPNQNSKIEEHLTQSQNQKKPLNQGYTAQGNINEWKTNAQFRPIRPGTTYLLQNQPAFDEWQASQTIQSQPSLNQESRPNKGKLTPDGMFNSNSWPNIQNSNTHMNLLQSHKEKDISENFSTIQPPASNWQTVHALGGHKSTAQSNIESQNDQNDNIWENEMSTEEDDDEMQMYQGEGSGSNFGTIPVGEGISDDWQNVNTFYSQSSQQPELVSIPHAYSSQAQSQGSLSEMMHAPKNKLPHNEWQQETDADFHSSKNHENWTNSAPASLFGQDTNALEIDQNTNIQSQSSQTKEVKNSYGTSTVSYGDLQTNGWENAKTTNVHAHYTNNINDQPQHTHPAHGISNSNEQSGIPNVNSHSPLEHSPGLYSQFVPNTNDWTNVHVGSFQSQENSQVQHSKPPAKAISNEKFQDEQAPKEESNREPTSQEIEDKLTNFSYKISLGIVFGATESMTSELEDVKRGIKDVLNTMKTRGDTIIGEYIWSPFGNLEVGPLTITSDPNDFERIINETRITTNGVRTNCQEKVLEGIKNALEVALPGSFIYLITDAVPLDNNALQVVSYIIKQKAIKVFVIKSNGCKMMGNRRLWEYEYLAQASSGQVFFTTKANFLPVFQYISEDLRSNSVTLAAVNRRATPPGKFSKFNLLIDTTIEELKVSLTGAFGTLRLINPQQKEVYLAETEILLNMPNIKVLKVLDPNPGKWSLRVESASPYSLRVTGISKIGFNYGFARILNPFRKPGIIQTHSRPLKDTQSTIFIETTHPNLTVRFVTVDILDLEGRMLSTLNLNEDSTSSGFFKASNFTPPTKFFNLQVNGFDENGFAIQRISRTPIMAEPPLKPVVVLEKKKFLGVGYMGRIKCHVESLIPVVVNWYKNGKLLDAREKCSETCTVYLRIRKVSEEISGNYVCEAVNKIGMEKKEIRLIAGAVPKISVPNPIYTGIGSKVSVKCKVRSKLPFMFRWVRIVQQPQSNPEMPMLSTPPLQEDMLLPLPRGVTDNNGILHIESVTEDMLGSYACIAKSAAGQSRAETQLVVSEALSVQVSKNSRTFSTGDCLRLTCVGYGAPPPDLKWVKNGKDIVDPVVEYAKKDTTLILMIPNAKREDAGTYSCIATNNYDLKVASAKIIFRPIDTPSDTRKVLMC